MSEISVINYIEVPVEMIDDAIKIRNVYMDYFRKQKGFVSSTFYQSISKNEKWRQYVNIVVWDSYKSFEAVVNDGLQNKDGLNNDGMKVLGKGFPEPIKVHPGQYKIIGN